MTQSYCMAGVPQWPRPPSLYGLVLGSYSQLYWSRVEQKGLFRLSQVDSRSNSDISIHLAARERYSRDYKVGNGEITRLTGRILCHHQKTGETPLC